MWRPAPAVASWLRQDPAKREGPLFVHPLSFSVMDGLPALEAELAALDPGLVLLDPAYRYMNGVRAQLFDMGAVLTPLQETCREAGARC